MKLSIGNRAFVFGGAYGNLQATEKMLSTAKNLGFEADEIIFTGDLVAYCGNPQETTDLIRESGCHMIMGNCEESLAAGAGDCGCGFEEGSTCSVLSDEWYRFCQSALSSETKNWMGTLPGHLEIRIGSYTLLCCHGTPETINEFVFPSDVVAGRYQPSDRHKVDGFVTGHSGIPFIGEANGKLWVNSGAAGMPANDGTPRIWYATLEASTAGLMAEIHSLDYDHDVAAKAMHSAGLKNGYADCLTSGIWPSFDVLPQEERAQTGVVLKEQRLIHEELESKAGVRELELQ